MSSLRSLFGKVCVAAASTFISIESAASVDRPLEYRYASSFRYRVRCRYISSQIGSSSLLSVHASSKSSIRSNPIACKVVHASGKGCVAFLALNMGDSIRFVCAHLAKQLP